jgi:acyl-coenzyme A synthetase/AMP-(fatty) acid ligase
MNGATSLMYEGAPNFPEPDRFWQIIDRHKVNIFYTAPTAIRTFMRWGDEWPKKHKLDSLRLLGTVGEPINPEAWMWYREVVGHDKCPIVDTWWQTETGAIMISPLPGITATKPGSCTQPLPGIGGDRYPEHRRSGPDRFRILARKLVPLAQGVGNVVHEHGRIPAADPDRVRAQGIELPAHAPIQPFDQAHHAHHRRNPDHDPQNGEAAPHLVSA